MGAIKWFSKSVVPALFNPFVVVVVLVILGVAFAVLWFDQGAIREAAVASVPTEVTFHAYMLGLFIPEGFLVGLIWNPYLKRYVSPFSGKMISGGLGIGLSVAFAFFGYFLFAPFLSSALLTAFQGWAAGPFMNLLGYWLYVAFSAGLLPFLMAALASPAGATKGLRWLWRALW